MVSVHQQKRIDKLNSDEFYLIGFDGKDILMTGSTQNVYKITLNENNSLSCNCPDNETHAKKLNVLCKHICFIYLKICKSTDLNFFTEKKLTNEDIQKLKNRTELLTSSETAKKYYEKYLTNMTHQALNFNEAKRDIELEECPICFDELKNEVKFCPQCSNPVHEKCIIKWLLSHDTCVYCRSDVWKKFGKKEDDICEKYVNLKA
jgi:hypothetical protein